MTSTKTTKAALRLRKTLNAPVEKVFKAWTDPQIMTKWMACDRVDNIKVTHDLRVGGSYRIEMSSGENKMLVTGVYKVIEENQKIVYTWASDFPDCGTRDSLVTVQFIDRGGSTEVILDHVNFDDENAANGHTAGWSDSLEGLARLFPQS